ncbi:hypothetical protein TCA2_3558 [Paenibacillus sp. TCA20]|nr:hypothetical protein TCA2_3558 [Paenibacillus sp. TCA20]
MSFDYFIIVKIESGIMKSLGSLSQQEKRVNKEVMIGDVLILLSSVPNIALEREEVVK